MYNPNYLIYLKYMVLARFFCLLLTLPSNAYAISDTFYYSTCPCFNSVADIRAAIGDNPLPKSCVARSDFSLLSDSPFTYTIQEYGNVFSCFYRNINTGEKDQIVQYGNQEEVRAMQNSCNAVLKKFAANYKIPCN